MPDRTHATLPKRTAGPSSGEPSSKLPNGAVDEITATNPHATLPKPQMSTAERLRRLEEAMAFLRQHLAAGPQPARTLLKAAYQVGIAERTLHRAKDLLGIRTTRAGGYAERGQWIWYPPAVAGGSLPVAARVPELLIVDSR